MLFCGKYVETQLKEAKKHQKSEITSKPTSELPVQAKTQFTVKFGLIQSLTMVDHRMALA